MRSILWPVLWTLTLVFPAVAQSTTESDDVRMDAILQSQQITRDEAKWLVEGSTGAQVQIVGIEKPTAVVTVADFSQLLLEAVEIPRGIMYSLFPGPRYAYRELVFRRIVPSAGGPEAPVSGHEALLYLQTALTWRERNP